MRQRITAKISKFFKYVCIKTQEITVVWWDIMNTELCKYLKTSILDTSDKGSTYKIAIVRPVNGTFEKASGGLNFTHSEYIDGVVFFWDGFNQTAEKLYNVFEKIIREVYEGQNCNINFRKLEFCGAKKRYHTTIVFPDGFFPSKQQRQEIQNLFEMAYSECLDSTGQTSKVPQRMTVHAHA